MRGKSERMERRDGQVETFHKINIILCRIIIMIIFQTMSSNHNIIRNNELIPYNTTANDFVRLSLSFSILLCIVCAVCIDHCLQHENASCFEHCVNTSCVCASNRFRDP